ncbi:hypothetical protein ONZ51_g3980 [Trametes cubensis]|uniref:Uncharacterized protein n=1 Tax=Trametes cubensis TaxID=1111947 RepID=A0AAD7XAQ4_9APHY|nr:hypothetical protein ONZ51_g3980 [Trametes cubensis]
MAVKYALKTACYIAMVGVLGHDERARRGVNFDHFVTALITVGFVWIPNSDGAVFVFKRVSGRGEEDSQQLRIPRPAACDGWWGYEYTATAQILEERFDIKDGDFVELPDNTLIEGEGFYIGESK